MDIRRSIVLLCVASCLPLAGCASKSGKNGLQSDGSSGWNQAAAPAPLNDARYQKLVREIEQSGGTASIPDTSESTLSKIGSSVKKATGSMASALTLKPKVIKAADPVSLDSMPEKIHADVYYQAGRLAESKGNRKAAAEQYRRALQTDSKHLPSLISLARLHDRDSEFAEAEQLYRQAVEVAPQSAMAYNDLGLCLARNQQQPQAVEALRHAVSLEPNSKLYRNNLATLLVDTGRVHDAWNELLGAHSPAIAHYNVGFLLHEKGDLDQARQQFQLALQKDATLVVAKEMLASLEGAPAVGAQQPEPIRYRVDDMMARHGGPAAPRSAIAQPVSVAVSTRDLRRIPPTEHADEPPRMQEPRLPATGPVVQPPALGPPVPLSQPPQSGVSRPPKAVSSNVVRNQVDGELPTPSLLREIVQR